MQGAGALAAGMAAPALLRVRSAYAAYPERPVKIVVANTPGGPSDIVARIVAAALQEQTGKTFIVENRGGAGGNIGFAFAAHSEPDGYTILLATNAYSINYGLYHQLPYDPNKDFVAISELASSPNTFVVKSELSAKSIKEFVRSPGPIQTNSTARRLRSVRRRSSSSRFSSCAKSCPNLRESLTRAAATRCKLCLAERPN